jgi:hypothetical protein
MSTASMTCCIVSSILRYEIIEPPREWQKCYKMPKVLKEKTKLSTYILYPMEKGIWKNIYTEMSPKYQARNSSRKLYLRT